MKEDTIFEEELIKHVIYLTKEIINLKGSLDMTNERLRSIAVSLDGIDSELFTINKK